jgi:hypothetical protein
MAVFREVLQFANGEQKGGHSQKVNRSFAQPLHPANKTKVLYAVFASYPKLLP